MARVTGVAAVMLALAGCNREVPPAPKAVPAARADSAPASDPAPLTPAERAAKGAAARSGDSAPYRTDMPLSEFMPHVMQYASDGIWKRQGFITDRNGMRSLFPKTDQEWEDAESASLTLAEITNVLLVPGRRVPDPEWDKAVLKVRAVALTAATAAERKDKDAFFAAGGDLDVACDYCHERFDPTFKAKQGGS